MHEPEFLLDRHPGDGGFTAGDIPCDCYVPTQMTVQSPVHHISIVVIVLKAATPFLVGCCAIRCLQNEQSGENQYCRHGHRQNNDSKNLHGPAAASRSRRFKSAKWFTTRYGTR